jgi:DinB superfamily
MSFSHNTTKLRLLLVKSWFLPRCSSLKFKTFVGKLNDMYTTSALIDNLYRNTEGYLEKAINIWQNLPVDVLMKQPSPTSWSASQCLEHLNIYGQYYLPAIEKAILKAQSKRSKPDAHFRSGWLGNYFYRLMLPNTEGVPHSKMQSPKNAIPSPEHDARVIVTEFINQQEKLLLLLEQARTVNISKIRIPISISPFIRLKLGDTFLFLIAHNQRHILQLERALRRM